jgi:hypothetical protein
MARISNGSFASLRHSESAPASAPSIHPSIHWMPVITQFVDEPQLS